MPCHGNFAETIFLSSFCMYMRTYLRLSFRLTALVTGNSSYLYSSGVGYSGVLFSYAVLESFHTTATSRSVFGLFSVPAKVFPFILLVLIQVRLSYDQNIASNHWDLDSTSQYFIIWSLGWVY